MGKHVPLYQKILGESYEKLPRIIQAMHNVQGEHRAHGQGRVERGSHPLSKLFGTMLGMPAAGDKIPVIVTFTRHGDTETISRNYGGTVLVTHQSPAAGRRQGLLMERFGPVTLFIRLDGDDAGITFHLQYATLVGITLPPFLRPDVTARERTYNGAYHYFVSIRMPFMGKLIEYEGFLQLEKENHHAQAGTHIDVV